MGQAWLWLGITVVCVGFAASALERRLARLERRLARMERRLNAVTSHLGIRAFEVDLDKVAALLWQGKKVQAIRMYRQLTGADLKEARDAVERMANSHTAA